jgi:non-homologous end joining protein Ku
MPSVSSNVVVSLFDLITFQADLAPVAKKVESGFRIVCPECDVVHKLSQKYVCSDDPNHGPYTTATAGRARELDKQLFRVTDEQIAESKGQNANDPVQSEAAKKNIPLSAVTSASLAQHTRPGQASYRLEPKASSIKTYGLIRDLVENSDVVFVGELTIRTDRKLFSLESWNGQLVLQERTRPDLLAEAEYIEASYDDKMLALATQLAADNATDFDPTQFSSAQLARLAKLEAELLAGSDGTPVESTPKDAAEAPMDNLLAALQAAVESK